MTKPNSASSSLPTEGGVVLDIGTGDGAFVYQSARQDPSRFYIGLDPEPLAMRETSAKATRKPAKGGLPNALFLRGTAESLPPELDGVADEVHVHFPWGSLLRTVLAGDEAVLQNFRKACAPNAWLEIVWAIDPSRDAGELARLGLLVAPVEAQASADHPPAMLASYARAGFAIAEHGDLDEPKWPHLNTSWAKRLRGRRRLSYLIARAS